MAALPAILDDPAQRSSLEERVAAARGLGADDPRLGRFVRIGPGLEVGLAPVTVAELARFVAGGGYRDRAYWSEAGWAWREAGEERVGVGAPVRHPGGFAGPRFWNDEAWKHYLGPNQPVVGVSYFEAEAYARFAGARLPTEEEWERAARGETTRVYPWGEAWNPANALHRGMHRGTLPVGCFPAGRGPHGLWDAAGNVWEWTAGHSERGLVTGKGGAWNSLPGQLRCDARNGWPPGARYSNIGFRLAR